MRTGWMLVIAMAMAVPLRAAPVDGAQLVPLVPAVCPPFDRGQMAKAPQDHSRPARFARPPGVNDSRQLIPMLCPATAAPRAALNTSQSSNGNPATLFTYVRAGEGALFADRKYLTPAVGFGVRTEFDAVAIDSSLNLQVRSNASGEGQDVIAGSVVNLRALWYAEPKEDRSVYLGGGVSWGKVDLSPGDTPQSKVEGNGLQAEITAGYEFARRSAIRMFAEANAVLPLYEATTQTTYSSPAYGTVETASGHRYAPSLMLSFGVGWQRQ